MKFWQIFIVVTVFSIFPNQIFAITESSPSSSFSINQLLISSSAGDLKRLTSSGELTAAEISPASWLFFIRTLKENFEYSFAEDKLAKKFEFPKNRVKEAYSAHQDGREDLIEPLMEEYRNLYSYFYSSPFGNVKVKMIQRFSSDINLLVALYGEVEDERAKRAIRASIDRIQAYNWKVLTDPNIIQGTDLLAEVKPSLFMACNLIGNEAKDPSLNQAESAILEEKFNQCIKRFI